MSNSVQTVVSNGSLTLLDLSINYFDRTHIKVLFNAVEQTLGTTWNWVGTTDKKIQFTPAVEAGVVVQVKRQTPLNAPRHVYSSPGNAPFNKSTVDENFLQALYASQEAAEGANLLSFAQDVSAAGYKLTDLGDAMLDGDAVSLKVLREYLPYGPAAASLHVRLQAEESGTLKRIAQGLEHSSKVANGFDGTGLADGAWVHLGGKFTVGDGLGGWFRYHATYATPVDNGVVFATSNGGRLVRDIPRSAPVEIDWYLPANYDPDTMSCLSAATAAWEYCVANKRNLHHGPRRYRIIGESSFPYGRINGLPPTELTDWGGIKVYGEGMATVLETDSVGGADVIQLNGPDHLEVCNFAVASYIDGAASGSNGVSITGGFDRLVIHDIWPSKLAFVDKTSYVDGGKGLSVQTPVAGQTVKCGSLRAWNIFATECVYGAGIEIDLVAAAAMSTTIDIEVVADSCREAVVISAAEATGVIPDDWQSGIKVRATAINCMKDVFLSRAHGVVVDCTVVTTKSDAARILSYTGSKWTASDTIDSVMALQCSYAHDSRISIRGNKGSCSYKALVGGNSAGASGLSGATQGCTIDVSVSGTASIADFGAIDSGGNVTSRCTLITSGDTAAPVTAHYAPAAENLIMSGNTQMLGNLLVQGGIRFTYADGKTSYAEIGYDDESVTIQQTLGSSVGLRPVRVLSHTGSTIMAVRNDGGIGLSNSPASSVSGLVAVANAYDAVTNTLVGYIPIYTTKA